MKLTSEEREALARECGGHEAAGDSTTCLTCHVQATVEAILAAHVEPYRSALARVEALADEWETFPCTCANGHASDCRVAMLDAALRPVPTEATGGCHCPPCPGRGSDGHRMTHCAECCFGTGVEADPGCPAHGAANYATTEATSGEGAERRG